MFDRVRYTLLAICYLDQSFSYQPSNAWCPVKGHTYLKELQNRILHIVLV